MNPDPIDFESQLARRPLRELPPEWRDAVLAQARAAAPQREKAAADWRAWLWPHPWAWAALAAIWLLIAGLNVSGPHGEALYAISPAKGNEAPFSPGQYAAYLRLRNLLLAASLEKPVEPFWPPRHKR